MAAERQGVGVNLQGIIMHAGPYSFVERYATDEPIRILEIGSRNINGTVRDHFPAADYVGVDLMPGPGVDVVGDASKQTFKKLFDLVLCCEVFEHTDRWPVLLSAAYMALRPGGRIIVTCAARGRRAHSGIDGGELRPDEHYSNLRAGDLAKEIEESGFLLDTIEENHHWHDLYAFAHRPE